MAVQVMEWGYIDWKHVKTENNPRQNMNIGIVVIEPGRHLAEHVPVSYTHLTLPTKA